MKQYKTPKIKIIKVALSDNISLLVSGSGDNSANFGTNWDPGSNVNPDILNNSEYWD